MLIEVNRMVPYARLRDRPETSDIARREMGLELLAAVEAKGLIKWTETKDPVLEAVIFTAKLEAISPTVQPPFPVKAPAPPKPETKLEAIAAMQDAIKRNFYVDLQADLSDGSLLAGPRAGRIPAPLVTATAAEADVSPPKPAPTPAFLNAAARKAALADVSAALDAVEADLLPGTDPGFVVALLRDRIKDLEK